MRKALGEKRTRAREQAVRMLSQLTGRNVKTLKDDEIRELLAAVLQMLGLADKDGNIE